MLSEPTNGQKIAALSHKARRLEAENTALKQERVPLLEGLKPVRKGYVAEQFAKYVLSRRGLECFDPPPSSEACDLLVSNGGKFYRCEVKGTTDPGACKVSHAPYQKGQVQRKVLPYGQDSGIDVFLLVDLTNERLFLIPSPEILGSKTTQVALTQEGRFWLFWNKFDVFMPT